MKKLKNWIDKQSLHVLISITSCIIIGIFDYFTDPKFSFSIFYIIPIAFATWFVGRLFGIIISAVCVILWLLSDVIGGMLHSQIIISYWNAVVRLGMFLIITFILSLLKELKIDLEKRVEKKTTALISEIEERKRAEKLIQYRLGIESVIASISKNFINLESDYLDIGVNDALRKIGEFFEVDRSYVFLFSPDKELITNTHEWCAEGIEPQIQNLQDLKFDICPWWISKLKNFENVHIPRVADLPDEARAEREIFQSQGIQSLIAVPINYEKSLIGFVGFNSVIKEKIWPEEDIQVLRIIAEILAAAFERAKSAIILKRNEASLAKAQAIAQIGSWEWDLVNNQLFWSSELFHILGLDEGKILPSHEIFFSIIHPDDKEFVEKSIEEIVYDCKPRDYFYRLNLFNGVECIVHERIEVISSQNGEPMRILGTVQDVTKSRQVEETLKKYEFMVNTLQDFVSFIDIKYQYSMVNTAFCKAHGKSLQDIIGRTVSEIWGEQVFCNIIEQNLEKCFKGNVIYDQACFEFPMSGLCFYEVTYTPFYNSNGDVTHAVVVTRDITEKKWDEIAHRESEERYRRFFEEDLTGDFICDNNGNIISCNPAFARIFGFESVDEARNAKITSFFPNKKSMEDTFDLLRKEKKLEYYEAEFFRIDGKPINVVGNIVGEVDLEGELIEIKGYLFDDTKRKQLEEQLRQTQKMEGIGDLAGGIAHDFNNILGIILGHLALIEGKLKNPSDKILSHINAINTSIQRGSKLISQILTFARKTNINFESLNINTLLEELNILLKETFPRNIIINFNLEKTTPSVFADHNQLHQSFLNIFVNARDAILEKSSSEYFSNLCKNSVDRISVESKTVSWEDLSEKFKEVQKGQFVKITVSDTGKGMDKSVVERIFEPFFTTKEKGKGTGLGLSVVYGVISKHNGFIDVESKLNYGTTFTIYLPIADTQKTGNKKPDYQKENVFGGDETILIIEDEDMLREYLEEILEDKGYTVLSAASGDQGIEIYSNYHNKIDVVISDIGLPNLSGYGVYQKIKEVNQHARVILSSGFIDPDMEIEIKGNGLKGFIHKPYNPRDILFQLRKAIDD